MGRSLGKMRASRASRWRTGVLLGIHLLIAIHIAHWLSGRRTLTPLEPSEAMEFVKHGLVNAGLLFFVLTIAGTAVFGRFFCGWGCHLVALQDLCRWILRRLGIRPLALRSRVLAIVPFLAFAYMFVWPAFDGTGGALTARSVHLTTVSFWRTFPSWIVGGTTFLVCGFGVVVFLGAKGFCTYACPYGAAFSLADRLAPGRIRVTDACAGCAHCTAACTSNVQVHREVREHGMVVSSGCMKCLDCVSVCPNGALYYGFGRPSAFEGARQRRGSPPRRPSRGEEAVLAASFAGGFLAFRGLYGVVPFLLALGFACILAYLFLTLFRLRRSPNVRLLGRPLRRAGRLLPGGRMFVGAMAAVMLLWGHAALVQVLGMRARRAFEGVGDLRPAEYGALRAAPPLAPEDRARAGRSLALEERLEAWSLVSDPAGSLRRLWLTAILGRLGEADALAGASVRRPGGSPMLRAAVRFELGKYFVARGRAGDAIRMFRAATRIDPESIAAYVDLGETLAAVGRAGEARGVYEQARGVAPGVPEVAFNLGVLEARHGRMAEAEREFRRALTLRPRYPDALHNLAGVLLSSMRWNEAIPLLRRALEWKADDAGTHHLLAIALGRTGDLEGALAEARRAAALDPRSKEIAETLARIRARAGKG